MIPTRLKFTVLLLLLELCGCIHSRLQLSLLPRSEHNWIMYGGDEGRKNLSTDILKPPLDSLWEYDAEAGFGSSAAAAIGDILLIGNLRGEVHAINFSTGKNVGFFDFGSAIVGTPLVDGEMMYVALANDGEGLIAYNLVKASIVWRSAIGNIESSPLLIGNRIYITTLEGKLICIEKEIGTSIWTYEISGERKTRSIRSSPASDGKVIVFGCDNGSMYAVDVNDGRLRWSAKTRASILASPSIQEGRVFIGSTDSTFYAFDVATGKQLWAQAVSGKINSSQAADKKHVYVATVNGTVYCLAGDDGSIVWKINTNGVINSAPLVSGATVYIGSLDRTLYALDSRSGEIIWRFKTDGRIKTMPVISQKHLFILAEDRSVVAFQERVNR